MQPFNGAERLKRFSRKLDRSVSSPIVETNMLYELFRTFSDGRPSVRLAWNMTKDEARVLQRQMVPRLIGGPHNGTSFFDNEYVQVSYEIKAVDQ